MTDGIATLKDYAEKCRYILQQNGFSDGYFLENHCVKLMSACARKNDVNQTIELASVLFDSGFIKPGTFRVLEQFVQESAKKLVARFLKLLSQLCVNVKK